MLLSQLKETYEQLNNRLHIELGKKESLEQNISKSLEITKDLEQRIETTVKSSLFLQTLSDTTRQGIIDKISSIVTDALQKVKDPNLEFKMVLSTERNQVDLKFFVVNKTTKQEYDILNSCGGGIADIVTFPLRVALLMKWHPELGKIIILDESFKFVGVQDQEVLADFVKQISEKLGIQIILITHSPTITSQAHKVFAITKTGETSNVEVKR